MVARFRDVVDTVVRAPELLDGLVTANVEYDRSGEVA
jgi:hypothetical protein